METDRATAVASATVLVTGVFWGLYWLPVRALGAWGLGGAWGTAAIALSAVALLLPLAWPRRAVLWQANGLALGAIALGGAAFALYSIGFLYGRVAIIILLWFLSPVWSTLIGRFVMGWPTPPLRIVAIVLGLIGLLVMLGAEGEMPLPQGLGEWMSLVGGILWSFSTVGIRVKSTVEPISATLVFAIGAAAASLLLAPMLEPVPQLGGQPLGAIIGLSVLTGGLWWAVSLIGLMWATVRLDPARVSILLMAEVMIGAVSAAVLIGEHLHPLELLGGALVLVAGLVEVWPARR